MGSRVDAEFHSSSLDDPSALLVPWVLATNTWQVTLRWLSRQSRQKCNASRKERVNGLTMEHLIYKRKNRHPKSCTQSLSSLSLIGPGSVGTRIVPW